jgi:hypothetical protein
MLLLFNKPFRLLDLAAVLAAGAVKPRFHPATSRTMHNLRCDFANRNIIAAMRTVRVTTMRHAMRDVMHPAVLHMMVAMFVVRMRHLFSPYNTR